MEDLDSTDYSSDRMSGDDIWVGSEGFDLADLEDFPVLGSERTSPAGLASEPMVSGISPSDLLSPPLENPCDCPQEGFGEPGVGSFGDARWREDGIFYSKTLDTQAEVEGGGLEPVSDNDRVVSEGVARQVELLLGSGSGGGDAEENGRIPNDPAALRGSASSERGSGQRQAGEEGDEGGKRSGVGTGRKRRNRWIKTKPVPNYAIGEDVELGSVIQMCKLTLVGRVLGHNFSRRTVVDWVEEKWKPLIGTVPVVEILNRGWFAFNFKGEEELLRILNANWHLNRVPVLMKRWHPLFDASRERVEESPIWVRLPALPLHYWDPFHFRNIGNILGTFLEADLSYLETHDKRVARILVSINLREGLAEQIKLTRGLEIITQILDYENVPFRCRRCYVYGHPASDCELPPRPGRGGRRSGARGSEGSGRDADPSSSDPDPSSSEDQAFERAGAVGGSVRSVGDVVPGAQSVSASASRRDGPLPGETVVEDSLEAPLEVVTVSPRAVHHREPVITGISSFTVSPSVNFYLNNVTLLGQDWVEGLRNLSLSGPSGSKVSRISPCVRGEEALGLNSLDPSSQVVLRNDSVLVRDDPSLVVLVPDPGDPPEGASPSHSDSVDSGYFLRSSKKASSVGLGKSPPVARKGRGRRSNLCKAQSRARVDLLEGKQLSIEKALRAVKAKSQGRK